MEKIAAAEVLDLTAYEKVRDAMRARVIERKRHRRIAVGDNITVLFENRETVLYQIQEMVRTERIVKDEKIREELDAYNALIPDRGELSATVFIEIPELVRMSQEEVRRTVNRFQGLDRDGVFLVLGSHRIAARFEEGHSKEEKMAAVHYVRFPVPDAARDALRDPSAPATIVVDHPNYKADADLAPATRAEMLADLA